MLNHRSIAGVDLGTLRTATNSEFAVEAAARAYFALFAMARHSFPNISFDSDLSAAALTRRSSSVSFLVSASAISPVAEMVTSAAASARTITETEDRLAQSNSSVEAIEILSQALLDLLEQLGASLAKDLQEADRANLKYLLQLKTDFEKRILRLLDKLKALKSELIAAEGKAEFLTVLAANNSAHYVVGLARARAEVNAIRFALNTARRLAG